MKSKWNFYFLFAISITLLLFTLTSQSKQTSNKYNSQKVYKIGYKLNKNISKLTNKLSYKTDKIFEVKFKND